ncbi:lactonase family protein [Bradyrhizobium sp. STM 3557]|uniref:lactonase family protein n=1 Tax=Bradyrhizobium sp. STM 3557 TaxID=578920 RepID=UPI0038905AD5
MTSNLLSDEQTGLLSSIGWQSTQGGGPRFFTLDPSGKALYAANELTDAVVAFGVDEATGTLTPTGQLVQTGSPTVSCSPSNAELGKPATRNAQ